MGGTFFFAWVDADEPFDPLAHAREDEDVFSFTVSQDEGDFSALEIEIRNPRIGLLAPARRVWCWLSYRPVGASPIEVRALFGGRLIGVPSSINKEVVTLVFTARPADYADQKHALASTLRVLPYYDPIWIANERQTDDDAVLEAYSKLWNIDRVTRQLTVTDVLTGEDGIDEFTEDDVFYDSVQINIGSPPLRSVAMEGKVNWTQSYVGNLDMGNNFFATFTGASLISDWPKPGAGLGSGWSVNSSSAIDVYGIADTQTTSFSSSWQNNAKTHANGDTMSISMSSSQPVLLGPFLSCVLTQKVQTGILDDGDSLSTVFGDGEPINIGASDSSTTLYVPQWQVNTTLELHYEAARKRTETIEFVLHTNVQSLVTLPGEDEVLKLSLASLDVGLPLINFPTPLADPSLGSYLPTPRGQQSLQYLIFLARANLRLRSRAIEVDFECTFDRAIELSCRKSALLHDDRLPGGSAVGKVISYSFSVNGDTGVAVGSVRIGCAIGYGGVVDPVAGTPDYVDEGYVELGYETYTGQMDTLPTLDVRYSIPIDGGSDDGLRFPLTKRQVVVREEIVGSLDAQRAAIEASFQSDITAAHLSDSPSQTVEIQIQIAAANKTSTEQVFKVNPISYELELKPLTGSFDVVYPITVSDLEIEQMINLEAAS